jgi:hypothetical protein
LACSWLDPLDVPPDVVDYLEPAGPLVRAVLRRGNKRSLERLAALLAGRPAGAA